MTSKELAALLDGKQYGAEITKAQEMLAANHDLVVVFGYSDDDVELRGKIDDEVGAYDGCNFLVTRNGVLRRPDCDCDECKYFREAKKEAAAIRAVWHDTGEVRWMFETQIPHETFRIFDGEELFCIGIVFSTSDLP